MFAALLCAFPSLAQDEDAEAEEAQAMTAISPIFGQLVMFSLPAGFATVFEAPTDTSYIREAVLDGETVEEWSQMITVTGAKGLASSAEITPRSFAAGIANGFQKACPDTYFADALGEATISGHPAFIAIATCGIVKSGNSQRSETALVVAIKGAQDYYTVQWAERGEVSAENLGIDTDMWKERLGKLAPIRLCAIVDGEAAPYPSCVNQGAE